MELMNVVILKCSQLFHLFFALMVASANRLYNESCNRSSLKGMFVSHTETCGDPTVSYKPPTHLRGLILCLVADQSQLILCPLCLKL